MATIQQNLFTWQDLDEIGDLRRLQLVLETLDDEQLMMKLEKDRGKGRDDYPVRAVWNSLLAAVVCQHPSIESLRRELLRNGDLLRMCGFETIKGKDTVPTSSAYTRFLKRVMSYQEELDKIFDNLVKALTEELPVFGKRLGIDGKAIESHARRKSKKRKKDGRRDLDADKGVKTYKGKNKDGSAWKIFKDWFGYKIHIIADVNYELPVSFKITKASASDMKQLKPMMGELHESHPEIVEICESMVADKGYDSKENNVFLWEDYRVKPIIDIKGGWKEVNEKLADSEYADNIYYDYHGKVYCYNVDTLETTQMAYCGFEKDRGTLKYRCPLAGKRTECGAKKKCGKGNYGNYGRIVRIPIEKDRRIFTPLARSSYLFKREYKKRTAVERINSRLDVSFGFENHYIRGMNKMQLRCSVAMIVMLAMALGRVREKKLDDMRSLVKAA